ncbi:hypothetical protein M3Y97_00026600 [Aphelenchoides bicaudatus]|nr:hypothetical protein M3Y97_00026600 [Aphelenchoides bicaudatus]
MEIALFVDNTALFRARVKALKLRQTTTSRQRLKSNSAEPQEDEVLLERSRLSTPTHEDSESASVSPNFSLYTAYARQICQHIRELADLVLERRKSYLLTSVNVYGHDNFMTDDDRRQFDSDTDLAMKQCSRLVRNLEFQLDNDQSLRGEDEYAHLKAITLLLNVYLKNVCKIVTELRSVHLKKTQYLNRICRLGNLVSMCGAKIDKRRLHDQQIKDQKQKELPKSSSFANMIRSVSSNSLEGKTFDGLKSDRLVSQPKDEPEKLDFDTADDQYQEDEAGEAHDVDLKPSEQAQLTAENQHLLERFIQRNSEIEQIETQFADLQKLQQTFIEKVVEQEKDIEIIHEKTIYTLDNLDQANDFIRGSNQEQCKSTGYRFVLPHRSDIYSAIPGLVQSVDSLCSMFLSGRFMRKCDSINNLLTMGMHTT